MHDPGANPAQQPSGRAPPSHLALRIIGLVVWSVVGIPRWSDLARGVRAGDALWLALYGSFAVCFALATSPRLSATTRTALLAAESVLAVGLAVVGMPHFEGALLAVVAAQAGPLVGARAALAWIGAQGIPLLVVVLPTHGLLGALKATGEYLAFSGFAVALAQLYAREAAARRELAQEHASLLAMQSLLADQARADERLRLAREVHDAIGHGLTAASLHLQLAERTAGADAPAGANGVRPRSAAAIEAAQRAVRETLVELRGLVGATREGAGIDLGLALRVLCAGVREPVVRLCVPSALRMADAGRAHALFRCVQEALTNAVRHAGADHVWVDVKTESDRTVAVVRDDGRGCSSIEAGFGLEGIRSRMSEVGGEAEFETGAGRGFVVRAWVPS
jgi:signal transduction histidine kinase